MRKQPKLDNRELLQKLGPREFNLLDVRKMFNQTSTWANNRVQLWLNKDRIVKIEHGLYRVNPDQLS